MTADLLLVNAIVGILLPLLVQLVVKAKAVAWVKTMVNIALSAVASALTPLLASSHVNWQTVALTFVQVFSLTIVSHYGILKPVGLTGAGGVIAALVPGGVGPVDPALESATPVQMATPVQIQVPVLGPVQPDPPVPTLAPPAPGS